MDTHIRWTRQLFARELESLVAELNLFPSEDLIWAIVPGITNSAGNIALHLCGNLQHFVGTVLGNTAYVRNRELEFTRRDVPRALVAEEIMRTAQAVASVLASMNDDAFLADYPDVLGGLRVETGLFLQHLSAHLAYHLGQVGYLRRALTGDSRSAGAISMHALSTRSYR